jgi:hypothetical protein
MYTQSPEGFVIPEDIHILEVFSTVVIVVNTWLMAWCFLSFLLLLSRYLYPWEWWIQFSFQMRNTDGEAPVAIFFSYICLSNENCHHFWQIRVPGLLFTLIRALLPLCWRWGTGDYIWRERERERDGRNTLPHSSQEVVRLEVKYG